MSAVTNCLKCGGAMEEGFMLDHGHYDIRKVTAWAPGKPESSFWTGVKVSNESVRKVGAFRCMKCGFLELYA